MQGLTIVAKIAVHFQCRKVHIKFQIYCVKLAFRLQHEINSHNIFFNTSNAASGDELGNSPVSPTPSGLAPYTPQGDEIAAPIINLVNIHDSSRKYIVVGKSRHLAQRFLS